MRQQNAVLLHTIIACALFFVGNFLLYHMLSGSKQPIVKTQQHTQQNQQTKEPPPWLDLQYQTLCTLESNHDTDNCARFTLIIQTFNRDEQLLENLLFYSEMTVIDKILIIWNNINRKPPPGLLQLAQDNIKPSIHVIIEEKNSINNRYKARDIIQTDAVMIMDDDIKMEEYALELAFKTWRNHPRKMVGFTARVVQQNPTLPHHCEDKKFDWYYGNTCMYRNGTLHTWEVNHFNLILPQALFLHKSYLNMYMLATPKELLDMVDEKMNCDDLFLAATHAFVTRETPLNVITTSEYIFDTSRGQGIHPGLHSIPGHYEKRTECLQALMKSFGFMPLMDSYHRIYVEDLY
jgi:alpha-1,4-N-acetylglucosaminyltransferase EXTL3